MQCWINGPATGGIAHKIKMANIILIRLRRTIIPSFHYSISGENSEAPKNLHILSRLPKFRDV
jgi:hypothetical protein